MPIQKQKFSAESSSSKESTYTSKFNHITEQDEENFTSEYNSTPQKQKLSNENSSSLNSTTFQKLLETPVQFSDLSCQVQSEANLLEDTNNQNSSYKNAKPKSQFFSLKSVIQPSVYTHDFQIKEVKETKLVESKDAQLQIEEVQNSKILSQPQTVDVVSCSTDSEPEEVVEE